MSSAAKQAVLPLLVAVDGSGESKTALLWAAEHAKVLRCELRILTCYRHHVVAGETRGISWEDFESTKQQARERAQEAIQSVLGTAGVEHVLALGPVDLALIDHSHDASMIVIGTRSTIHIGAQAQPSLTDRVTGRAHCPVMSVPLGAPVLEAAL